MSLEKHLERLRAREKELEQEVRALTEALRELEWAHAPTDYRGDWYMGCPSCAYPEDAGHKDGCRLKRALTNGEKALVRLEDR